MGSDVVGIQPMSVKIGRTLWLAKMLAPVSKKTGQNSLLKVKGRYSHTSLSLSLSDFTAIISSAMTYYITLSLAITNEVVTVLA